MNDKKPSNEYRPEPWEEGYSYRTGSTQPPKSHRGLIAFLLGLVIFLCGISTALGLMNIKLRWQLNQKSESDAVAFSRCGEEALETLDSAECFSIGFCGEEISDFWNIYGELPRGIYITDVAEAAAAEGIVPGDILLSLDGVQITRVQTLRSLLDARAPGDAVEAVIYRAGSQLSVTLTVE